MTTRKKLVLAVCCMLILCILFTKGVVDQLEERRTDKDNVQEIMGNIEKQMQFAREKSMSFWWDKWRKEVILSNVWIEKSEQKRIFLFINGKECVIEAENVLSNTISNMVGDVTLKNGKVYKVAVKPEKINGKVLSANRDYIEIEIDGEQSRWELDENFKIYRTYGTLSMEKAKGILVGYDNTEFVIANNKICAGLITSQIHAKNIRVLLKTDGFKDIFHEKVVVTSQKPFTVSIGEKETEYKAGEEVTIKSNNKALKKERIVIESTEEEGKITLLSLLRNQKHPSYRGRIELSKYEDNMVIVNELSLEEYLYAVLPSEMPSSYGIEALKVQAVCARSYAYTHLLANNYPQYGAHVDDSVSYQVYNNTPETEETILAVKETHGQVLQYEDSIITAYYFSTSSGHTSSAKEVWLLGKELSYLEGAYQVDMDQITEEEKKNQKDLTIEENMREFLLQDTIKTYDSEFPWYRWTVSESAKQVQEALEKSIAARYKANPNLIQTRIEDGTYESKEIESIGKVKNIKIGKRGTGGLITELIIEGSKETVKVMSEYNIRVLLAPLSSDIIRQDKSKVSNQSMLPSAFFVIDRQKEEDGITFLFSGGGYGHGVGMSQNGTKQMADNKKTYKEILQHYYFGTELGFIY